MAKRQTITVREFLDADPDNLELSLVEGEAHLDRVIPEPMINRPGLALAGHLQYFANKRVQVFGLAETTYLQSLSQDEREKSVEAFFEARVPAVIVSRGRKIPSVLLQAAQRHKVSILRTRMITGDFINQATVAMETLTASTDRIYGTMVDIADVGVLITGNPGIGKSEAALALIERGHSLVSDDVTLLRREPKRVTGRAPDATKYHMEIRGLGIVHVAVLYGVNAVRKEKELHMIVELVRAREGEAVERTGLDTQTKPILGLNIPYLRLPVSVGRDMANVLEVAALNQKSKNLGVDAAVELNKKLIEGLLR